MKLDEILEALKEVKDKNVITLVGEVKFKVNKNDALAAELLEWLWENGEEDMTVGDVLDILANAEFWLTFWHGLEK